MTAEVVPEVPSRAVPWPAPVLHAPDLYRRLSEAVEALSVPTPCGEQDAGSGWLVERVHGAKSVEEKAAVAAAVADAVAGCGRCPVLAECREYALAAKEWHGVWGGLDMVDKPWRRKRQAS